MKEFLKIFVMYLGIGFGAALLAAVYMSLVIGPTSKLERNACLTGWKHSALHYKVLDQQTPEAIIEYGRLSCEEWYK